MGGPSQESQNIVFFVFFVVVFFVRCFCWFSAQKCKNLEKTKKKRTIFQRSWGWGSQPRVSEYCFFVFFWGGFRGFFAFRFSYPQSIKMLFFFLIPFARLRYWQRLLIFWPKFGFDIIVLDVTCSFSHTSII